MRLMKTALVWLVVVLKSSTPKTQAQSAAGTQPVGLSLFFNNGTMKPVTFYGNPARYIAEIDLVTTTAPQKVDDGIDSLMKLTDQAKLDWRGVKMVEEDWRQVADGTFRRQRFYRNANWMNAPSQFSLYPTDGRGKRLGAPLTASAGRDDRM